jgi:hypothetical protein
MTRAGPAGITSAACRQRAPQWSGVARGRHPVSHDHDSSERGHHGQGQLDGQHLIVGPADPAQQQAAHRSRSHAPPPVREPVRTIANRTVPLVNMGIQRARQFLAWPMPSRTASRSVTARGTQRPQTGHGTRNVKQAAHVSAPCSGRLRDGCRPAAAALSSPAAPGSRPAARTPLRPLRRTRPPRSS